MKISKLIDELNAVKKEHGEIEVALQDSPPSGEPVTGHESFFVVPEEYEDEGGNAVVICNIRWWPY